MDEIPKRVRPKKVETAIVPVEEPTEPPEPPKFRLFAIKVELFLVDLKLSKNTLLKT